MCVCIVVVVVVVVAGEGACVQCVVVVVVGAVGVRVRVVVASVPYLFPRVSAQIPGVLCPSLVTVGVGSSSSRSEGTAAAGGWANSNGGVQGVTALNVHERMRPVGTGTGQPEGNSLADVSRLPNRYLPFKRSSSPAFLPRPFARPHTPRPPATLPRHYVGTRSHSHGFIRGCGTDNDNAPYKLIQRCNDDGTTVRQRRTTRRGTTAQRRCVRCVTVTGTTMTMTPTRHDTMIIVLPCNGVSNVITGTYIPVPMTDLTM